MKTNKYAETLTIKQYEQLMDIVLDNELEDIEKVSQVLQVVYGKSEEEVNNMKVSDIDLSMINIRMPDKLPIPYEVVIDGKKFKVCSNLKDLTFGQFVDLQVAIGEIKDNKIHHHIGSIVKCFLLDDEGKYAYDVDVSNMRLIDAYPIFLFFYKFKAKLEAITQRYLEKEERKAMRQIAQMLR